MNWKRATLIAAIVVAAIYVAIVAVDQSGAFYIASLDACGQC